MNKEDNGKYIKKAMWELVAATVDVLPSDISRKLLVSVQRTNVDLCIKYAIEKYFFLLSIARLFWQIHCSITRGPILSTFQSKHSKLDNENVVCDMSSYFSQV